MTNPTPATIKSVAIIGAGPSGLTAAKALLAENVFSKIVIYEQRDSVGGIWNYTPLHPKRNNDGKGNAHQGNASYATDIITANLPKLNTPMYEGLESNLPHMVMQFSNEPFPAGTQLFPSRETVLQYLQNYANDLISTICLNHQVLEVKPVTGNDRHGWDVTVRATGEREVKVEKFDAVIAANGHCDWPMLPDIEGLDAWSKRFPESLSHSVSYKNAKVFANKRVLLVGGGPSGADIERQIASVCKHPLLVAQIAKSPYHTDEPCVIDYPSLVALVPEERAAKFEDGNIERDIDAIILCTGYAYSFPFLIPIEPTIQDEGIRALPLYQYSFHMQHPNLAIMETPEMAVPFPLAECQAAVIARVWSGRLNLPGLQEMEDWREIRIRERGPGRPFHALAPPLDLEYMKEMYNWSREAKATVSSPDHTTDGLPKQWDVRACWERTMAAEMRKGFIAKGEERSHVLHYEELGFCFDERDNGHS